MQNNETVTISVISLSNYYCRSNFKVIPYHILNWSTTCVTLILDSVKYSSNETHWSPNQAEISMIYPVTRDFAEFNLSVGEHHQLSSSVWRTYNTLN